MKRCIRALTRLYPSRWRARYGAEFDALLEEAPLRWHDTWDIFKGAIQMQLANWTLGKSALFCGLSGAVLATAIGFTIPDLYISTSTLRLTQLQAAVNESTLQAAAASVFSRTALTEVIKREDLYPQERRRKPLEDVIEEMKHNLHIASLASRGTPVNALSLQFTYDDPAKAQRVVREVSANFASMLDLQVLDPANLPQSAIFPNRKVIGAMGFVAGSLLGTLIALGARVRRRTA